MKLKPTNTKQLTQLAMLFALSIVLMSVESAIPPIPTLPPGIKLGLSNIVVMFSLLHLGRVHALSILTLKSTFVLITRGITPFLLSLSGGILSLGVMILLLLLKKYNLSYIIISISASVSHNIAQLLVASLLLQTSTVFYYSPVLIISGVIMGIITGVILKVTLPAMKRITTISIDNKKRKTNI